MRSWATLGAIALASLLPGQATRAADGFDIVVLGALGGIQDGNLSAYLIHPHADTRAVVLDVGTLVNGLRVADEKGAFNTIAVPADSGFNKVGYVLTETIKGYLVSHAHLDHVGGLIVASPDDSKKPIYALASVNSALLDTYFNWQAWPNFGDRGKAPQLKKYALEDLKPAASTPLQNTRMSVTAFPLAHDGVESTAFLVESDGDAVLYFGDAGPDAIEKSTRMAEIWAAVADKARQRKLKAILIESSYTSDRPDNLLFGHLTPKWIMQSLHALAEKAGRDALKDLPVIVTHIKYALTREQPQKKMMDELQAQNELGVRFLLPEQGTRWHFK